MCLRRCFEGKIFAVSRLATSATGARGRSRQRNAREENEGILRNSGAGSSRRLTRYSGKTKNGIRLAR